MKKQIIVQPKHWYHYLSPGFWREKRVIEDVLNNKEMMKGATEVELNRLIYGDGFVKDDPNRT